MLYNGNKADKYYFERTNKMSDNRLVKFIASLTEEQIERIIAELPKVTALLAGPDRPSPPEPSLPNP